jgi:hypothetical protein
MSVTQKAIIIGSVRAVPFGDERLPSGERKNWIILVNSEDNGEGKATALCVPEGPISKASAERFAEMLNDWAGKESYEPMPF